MKNYSLLLALLLMFITTAAHALVPQHGKTYYLYCDNDQAQWFYNNNGKLAVAANCNEGNPSFLWTCTRSGNDFYFENGAGGYMGYKAMSNGAYAFRVSDTDQVVREGCVTIYAQADSRYLVMNTNGAFDQASRANYDKATTNYSSDFVFVEYVASATSHTVTISCNYPTANARFCYDGKYVTGSGSLRFDPEDMPSDCMLTCTGYNAAYVFEGFFQDGILIGNVIDLSKYDTDINVEARFRLDCFSNTYGEKWIRLDFAMTNSCCATVQYGTTGETPYNMTTSSNDDGQLWCMVGNAESFKLYNRKAGETLALTANGSKDGDATFLTSADQARYWHLIDYSSDVNYPGFAISLVSVTDYGINSYGGNNSGWPLKFWKAEGGGSHWQPVLMDTKGVTVNYVMHGTPIHPDVNTRVAVININMAGNTAQQIIELSDMGKSHQYVLPTGSTFSITAGDQFRGYHFVGVEGVEDARNIPSDAEATVVFEATEDTAQILFYSNDEYHVPYRIPAITTAHDGRLIAIADRRYCKSDIGYGHIDIVARTSEDNGATWSEDQVVCRGSGIPGSYNCGYGDACVVADRESNRVLMMCVTGNVVFTSSTRANRNRHARTYSNDGGKTWQEADDITDQFYALLPNTNGLFVGSGRICQSHIVKKGQYYRLYAAMLTNTANSAGSYGFCNFVIYSDDFGETWNVLGGTANNYSTDSPCVGGDEPKVEELPNGDILLSSRKSYGRYFNVFRFTDLNTDQQAGTWQQAVQTNQQTGGISIGANSCNGEVLSLPVVNASTGKTETLLLQSIPFGNSRTDVGIWYRTIQNQQYTPVSISTNWTKGLQVTNTSSAYSTMTLQADGRIGFLFEEGPAPYGSGFDYNIVYLPLSVEQITAGKYLSANGKEEEPEKPVTVIPENGKTYYIYCDNADAQKNDIRQYLFLSSDGLSVSNIMNENANAQWTCTQENGRWVFRNRQDGYLGMKVMTDVPYEFVVSTENAYAEGNVTIFGVADSKYLAVTNKGVVAAASNTYDKTSKSSSTDFHFVEIDTGEEFEGPLPVRMEVKGQLPVNNPRLGTIYLQSGSQYIKVEVNSPDTTFRFTVAKGAELQCGASYLYRGLTLNGASRKGDEIVVQFTYDNEDESRYLTYTLYAENVPYRIPAVTSTRQGRLINFIDRRYSGDDIGNNGRLDICETHSDDNGNTWTPLRVVLQGNGKANNNDCAYGDACTVADRESDRVLLITVGGSVRYTNSTRTKPVRIKRAYSDDGGDTWSQPEDITDRFFALGDYAQTGLFPNSTGLFIASGRICQSRLVKVGDYYRLYAAVISTTYTKKNSSTTTLCNFVIYSDDFGQTWQVLGSADGNYASNAAIPTDANEAKVEELANGNILISSRKSGGRYMNLFTFNDFANDKTSGSWGSCQNSSITVGAAAGNCNGDLLMVPAVSNATGQHVSLYLQSLPCGTSRENVGVWYRAVSNADEINATTIAREWKQGMLVSQQESAYSSMALQGDGRVAFVLEEAPTYRNTYGYATVYVPLSVEQLTKGAYTFDATTAVSQPHATTSAETPIFDLSGRRVTHPSHSGIYIQAGRKTLIK